MTAPTGATLCITSRTSGQSWSSFSTRFRWGGSSARSQRRNQWLTKVTRSKSKQAAHKTSRRYSKPNKEQNKLPKRRTRSSPSNSNRPRSKNRESSRALAQRSNPSTLSPSSRWKEWACKFNSWASWLSTSPVMAFSSCCMILPPRQTHRYFKASGPI